VSLEAAEVSSTGSVTHWIGQFKDGDPRAAQRLWERYFGQMVRLAQQRLRHLPRRAADEEDVALSAFDSFYRSAGRGRFPQLADREDLWQVLVLLTARKASALRQREQRQKRGGGQPAAEAPLDQVIGPEPTPEFAAEVADEFRRLLDGLGDDGLRAIALAKMEGYSNEEIATQLACAPRTVERKLRRIRDLWAREGQP
jgi:DNA-directed RNA polymerase specialized sigma24 family protein